MKEFRFRAQAVLDLRNRHRDVVQAELAQAVRAEQAATDAFEGAEQRGLLAAVDGADALRAGGSVSEFERHRYWIARLRDESERLRRIRQERATEVSKARERLRSAHQQVRVLERLRDQLWQRHQEDVRQQEMRDLNEVATLRFARQHSEGRSERGS